MLCLVYEDRSSKVEMGIDDEHRWRIDRYNQLEVGCLKVAAAAATTTEVVTIIINSNTRTCVYYYY